MPLQRALIGVVALATTGLLPAQNPPPGFVYETLVDGPLSSATAMAFLPDGRLLLTERETGRIRQFRDGALDPQPWATTPAVSGGTYSESGLLGLAVDPGFLSNHYVYVYYSAGGGENAIARLEEVNGTGTNLTVLTPSGAIPGQLYHNGGAMVFGHDGTLFVATGDSLGAANAQNQQLWQGKILRFEVPNLTIPANNPFAQSPVYSLGHRNHFGLAIHPATGVLYQTENGGQLQDELNRILPGNNYGWPVYEGLEPTPNAAYADPLAVYSPTMAPTGCTFYDGEHYPALYQHAWFVTDYNENKVRAIWLSASGAAVANQVVFDQHPGSGYGVVNGPDGNLWYLTNDNGDYGADELGRYVYQGEASPSLQLSSVSNRALGASMTICVHGHDGDVALPWVSWTRYPTALPTPWGNLWVPLEAVLVPVVITADDRAYSAVPVPNAPAFLGVSLHGEAMVLRPTGVMALTNPSEYVLRG